MPRSIWLAKRINDLVRAIHEYGGLTGEDDQDKLVRRWLGELGADVIAYNRTRERVINEREATK